MTIEYVLYENRLTTEPDDYMAVVVPNRIIDLNAIADRMVEQGSTVTRADILSVMEDFQTALFSLLAEGANVNTPFANFSSSIKGVFNGINDSYNSARHQVVPIVNPGRELRDAYRQDISVQRKEATLPAPNPLEYTDTNTGERNSIITPSGLGQIDGHRLKFDSADDQQGIFFIAVDGTTTRVSVTGQNKPSKLIFINPNTLTTGDYSLEVRSLVGQTMRSGRLNNTLSVA